MKRIHVTPNSYALVDDDDFDLISSFRWHQAQGYAKGVKKVDNKLVSISMHRLIMNPKKGEQVDHINRNRLDNRKENLRICDMRQNQGNRIGYSSTGFKGVYRNRQKLPGWFAQIRDNKKIKYLGNFPTPEEAARAYDRAAIMVFGEFAKLNFDL